MTSNYFTYVGTFIQRDMFYGGGGYSGRASGRKRRRYDMAARDAKCGRGNYNLVFNLV